MAIRLLNEADSDASTKIYFEMKLIIEVAEHSWGSSDPVDAVAGAVADSIAEKAFDTDRFERVISREGYTITDSDYKIVDGSLNPRKDGNEATVYCILGGDVTLAGAMTSEKDAEKLARAIHRDFPPKETSYPLEGIVIDGYPLRKSDLDKPDADITCYVSTLGISSEGRNLYFG